MKKAGNEIRGPGDAVIIESSTKRRSNLQSITGPLALRHNGWKEEYNKQQKIVIKT